MRASFRDERTVHAPIATKTVRVPHACKSDKFDSSLKQDPKGQDVLFIWLQTRPIYLNLLLVDPENLAASVVTRAKYTKSSV